MDNLAADFTINTNNSIEAEFALQEGHLDCSFELFAAGTVWGSIDGTLSDQTDLQNALDAKQDVLTAGDNIQIENNVISATDTTYTAGTGISIENGVISNTQTSAEWGNIEGTLSNQTDLQNELDDLSGGITANHDEIGRIGQLIGGYGDIVNYDASDFATAAQGTLADTALQPNDNISELVNDSGYITGINSTDVTNALGYTPYDASNPAGYITSASLPTNYVTTDTAQTISVSKAFSQPIVMADNNGLASGTLLSNKKILQRTSGDNTLTLNNKDNKLRLIGSETRPKYSADGTNFTDLALSSDIASYTAGTGIDITSNTISVTSPTVTNNATGTNALAVGDSSQSTAEGGVAVGDGARANSTYSTAVGQNTRATNTNTTVIGRAAKATEARAIAIGSGAEANAQDAIAIKGINNTANTFQVYTYNMLDMSTGLIPDARISTNIARTSDMQTADSNLQSQIDTLKARGRFLALWNCATGLAQSNPPQSPYTYQNGDYFIVGTVSTANPAVNYKPNGSSYTTGVASTTLETDPVDVDDVYYYDGTNWRLQVNTQKTVSFVNIAGSPYDNTSLSDALNAKQGSLTAGTGIDITSDTISIDTSVVAQLTDIPTNYVTTDTAQNISGRKTFLGEKAIYFKQSSSSNKLGFTLYNTSNSELGAFEYRPNTISGNALININTSYAGNDWVGFRYWGTAVNIVAPKVATAGDYYIPVNITDGNTTVTANSTGTVNISSLLPNVSGYLINTATGIDSLTILSTASTADYAVNIGVNSEINADYGVAVGYEASTYDGVAIGYDAVSGSGGGVAIGRYADAETGEIAIGTSAAVNGVGAITIGYQSGANGDYAICIGEQSGATNDHAIQIGYGTNNTANTLQIESYTLLNTSTGLIPDARLSSNIARLTDFYSKSEIDSLIPQPTKAPIVYYQPTDSYCYDESNNRFYGSHVSEKLYLVQPKTSGTTQVIDMSTTFDLSFTINYTKAPSSSITIAEIMTSYSAGKGVLLQLSSSGLYYKNNVNGTSTSGTRTLTVGNSYDIKIEYDGTHMIIKYKLSSEVNYTQANSTTCTADGSNYNYAAINMDIGYGDISLSSVTLTNGGNTLYSYTAGQIALDYDSSLTLNASNQLKVVVDQTYDGTSANPQSGVAIANAGFLTGITSGDVTTALGYTPYSNSNPDGYITGINSSDVTTALGYTPADNTLSNVSSIDGSSAVKTALDSKVNTADVWMDYQTNTLNIGIAQS